MNTPSPPADPNHLRTRPQPQIKTGTTARRIASPKPFSAAPATEEGQRLSKVVMAQAQCSRMEAERLIEAGRVQVDGVVCQDVPRRIRASQQIDVLGAAPAQALAAATFLLHKPAGMGQAQWMERLTEAHHAEDRSAQLLLKKHLQHLNCVAPLEAAASGLVVLTQHPSIARVFHEPLSLEHELMAEVQGVVSPEQLQQLNHPSKARAHGRAWPAHIKASISHQTPKLTRVRLAIKGYQPGDALDLCLQADLCLLHLWRIRIGRMALKNLPEGQWRFLLGYERF